ncbi:hypothetical protein COB52_05455 [Candidatus Kaiserbacteria bacterium]|nr:MAG: hypothetical protein COB52_05455 [Candidatus Kaiserbacteria bacterium]
MILLTRFFDDSNIKLNGDKAFSTHNKCLDATEFMMSYWMLTENEQKQFLENVNDLNIIEIFYKVEEFGDEDEVECLPVAMKPERLSMAHYDIKFDKTSKRITNIINRKYGAIIFKQTKIDSDVNFMFGSQQMTIYTSEHQQNIINIVHIQLDDMGDTVSIKAEYMQEGTDVGDYTKDSKEKDAAGQILRYLILIKEDKIFKVMYNTGDAFMEVKFIELRFKLDQYVTVSTGGNKFEYGKIT